LWSFQTKAGVTVYLFMRVPKGFIPSGDSGLLLASTEAAQGISFEDMVKHQNVIADIIQHDPNVESMSSTVGAGGRNSAGNTGTIFIVLKPPNKRKLSADQVVEELRPSLLDHFGLPTALRTYVESTCAKAGLTPLMVIEHPCDSMSKDAAIALFRIVQEGLVNIIRHAKAKTVKLELSGDERHCVVTLTDDGHGFDSNSPQFRWSHGLMGMRQRAEALGGQLDIESRVGSGTRVRVEIPVSRQ